MVCEIIKDENGHIMTICCSRSRVETCKFCRIQPVSRLCDFPVGPRGKTCDAGMCDKCATRVAHEVDYCPSHRDQKPAAEQASLFGGTR
jgi:hypothetical protein